jgi:hypothetical protein
MPIVMITDGLGFAPSDSGAGVEEVDAVDAIGSGREKERVRGAYPLKQLSLLVKHV